RKSAILGGLYAWSLICMATSLVRGFRGLFTMRAAEGLGETFYFPASMSLIGDYHGPATRSRAVGVHQTSVYIGTIAGGFFAGLIGQVYGWRWSFVLFGALGILLGLVLRRFLREPVRGQAEIGQADEPTPRIAVLLMLAFGCANFVAVVLLTWMPKFLYDRFHLSLAMAGLTATIYVQLASLCGALFGGWMADKWRARRRGGRMLVQAIGVFGGAPFVVLCGMTESVGLVIVALTVWGFFKGLYDANIYVSVFDVVSVGSRGKAAGLMNTVGWLGGGGTAPIAIGWLSQSAGLGSAIAMASGVYVAAGILLLTAAWKTERQAYTGRRYE
ncbi:MAG TPA: MFS transporter, partial [Bryobacteraceae bacterium]|nr:MFS transporter [Bryobacteraceae bacterium]